MKRELDFIIIGAQKSGTTSLYKYLLINEEIYLPPEKEAPYFSSPERMSRGWNWYLEEFFKNSPDEKLWGKATPQYMAYPGVSLKIKRQLPNVKLIALLRNPVDRALSHYKMSKKRGLESRGFYEAITDQLNNIEFYRKNPSEVDSYICWGEYGRILTDYYYHFNQKQILVLFTDDLKANPQHVMNRIFDYLEIERIESKEFMKKHHIGSANPKFAILNDIKRIRIAKAIWRKMIPFKFRRRLGYWVDQWNTSSEGDLIEIDNTLKSAMMEHFREDFEPLSKNNLVDWRW